MKARKTSKLALTSFGLAIFTLAWPLIGSFVVAPILMLFQLNEDAMFNMSIYFGLASSFAIGLAAVITGIIALRSMKKHKLLGEWMAISGIIIGAIPVALIGTLVLLTWFFQ